MGSYDAYDYAFDDRFATPSFVPPGIEQIRDTIKWRLLHLARSCAPRFENYFRKVDYRITAQRYARWRSTQDKCWYARLPRKIERPAISLNAKTSDQLQSRFFQMPLEVREMIYDYIFDGGAVRLDAQEKVNEKVVRNKEPYKLRSFEPHPGLAVLKACKRTYVEAAHLLYTTNTFIFPDFTTFMCFQRLVPSYHWHIIKSICIVWDYDELDYDFQYSLLPCPTNEQTWNEVCRAISKMQGLEILTVDIKQCPMSPYQDRDRELAQPLREITAPAIVKYLYFDTRKALVGRCGCGCGRAKGFHGSGPFDISEIGGDSD